MKQVLWLLSLVFVLAAAPLGQAHLNAPVKTPYQQSVYTGCRYCQIHTGQQSLQHWLNMGDWLLSKGTAVPAPPGLSQQAFSLWAEVWQPADAAHRISPYDHLVKKYADKHGVDWTLVIAQMFQESRFNPKAISPAGAVGLMQLMPATAQSMGYRELHNPETSIRAGVQYYSHLRKRLAFIPKDERHWFVLASYNAGLGHILDARRLAKAVGLNPNRWFGHVEKALLLLSNPEIARHAPHGYVRAHEPVGYVRSIRKRWYAYRSRVQQVNAS